MDRKGKRKARGGKTRNARRRRAETAKNEPQRSCHDCVFCTWDKGLWLRTLLSGRPVLGMCANHPDAPGRLREVPGRPCRNFRGKPRRVAPPEPPNDKVRYIPLTRGLHAIVDAEDYEWLSQYKWYAAVSKNGTFYARRNGPDGVVSMHRAIIQAPDGKVVDHINGNGLDNRRSNLRVCTQYENALNSRPRVDSKSRFKGVIPHGKKWRARVGGKHVGLFDDEIEAAKARDQRALELYGEHAWLNFPPKSEDSDK